jgi:hypothetical protein
MAHKERERCALRKIALILDIPEDKPAGFYEEIIKALDQRVTSFDLDKELVVLNSVEDRDTALELLEHAQIISEELILLLLPLESELYLPFSDYGFTSKTKQHYLYEHLIRIFRFSEHSLPLAEASSALLQMQEHLIAHYRIDATSYYAIDYQFIELIERIAIAYKCSVFFPDAH